MTRKLWFWPALVVALLGAVVVADAVMIWVAVSDPSFAVEEDYYPRAVAWDETMAARRRSDALGWSVRWALAPQAPGAGGTEVTAILVDRSGAPVEGARVTLETFHNARAATVLRAELRAIGDGRYAAVLPMRRPGLWEMRLDARRGDDRLVDVATEELPGAR